MAREPGVGGRTAHRLGERDHDPEVDELVPRGAAHHVRGLHVPVDEPRGVDGGERPRQVDPRVDDLAHRPAAPALQPVLEALAARQLHHETGDAARVVALERVAADHVGVLDAVERAGLVDDRRAPPLRFERRRDDVGGIVNSLIATSRSARPSCTSSASHTGANAPLPRRWISR